jgi:hypothetical protein
VHIDVSTASALAGQLEASVSTYEEAFAFVDPHHCALSDDRAEYTAVLAQPGRHDDAVADRLTSCRRHR